MEAGTVLWFNDEKGFGWILSETGRKVFVHYSAIQQKTTFKKLEPGQKVVYDLYETQKGQLAKNVVAEV